MLYIGSNSELEPADMMFNVDLEHFVACTQSRAKGGVNWLAGSTDEDSEWTGIVRRSV